MVLTSLFDGRLEPLTYSIGFLSAPPERVVRAARWLYFRWPDAWRRVAVLDCGLEEALLQLQPLEGFLHPRVLVASTALNGWSAVFNGRIHGLGGRGLSVRLSRALRVPGYFVAAAPPASDPEHFPGFRQFYVLGPQTGRDHVRAVWVVDEEEDVGRWHFGTDGEVQPYEDVEAYRRRRRTDRLTERMLVDYAAAVGLRPWEDSFYRPPFHLITSLRLGRDRFQRTLAQMRTEMKLDE
mgnify:FL=1